MKINLFTFLFVCFSSLLVAQAPANDAAANAEEISIVDEGCPDGGTVGTTVFANNEADPADNDFSCDAGVFSDVYYSFTVPAAPSYPAVDIVLQFGTAGNALNVEIYDAADPATIIACVQQFQVVGGVTVATVEITAGTTYVVRVGSESPFDAVGSFIICAQESFNIPSPNDACADAIELTWGEEHDGTFPYNNTSATGEPATEGASCIGAPFNDVWFTFEAAGTSASISTDYAGSGNTDTQIAVYSGDCSGLTELDCDDDGGNVVGLNSIVDLTGLTIGETYYVQVDGWNQEQGDFDITVLPPPPPACVDATDLTGEPTADFVGNTGVIGSADNLNCNGGTLTGSVVWYTYTPTVDGTMDIDLCGSDDTELAVFESADDDCVDTDGMFDLTCVDYNDDSNNCPDGPTGFASQLLGVPVTAGTTYYIAISGWLGGTADLDAINGFVSAECNNATAPTAVESVMNTIICPNEDPLVSIEITDGLGPFTVDWTINGEAQDQITDVEAGTFSAPNPGLTMIGANSLTYTIVDACGNEIPEIAVNVTVQDVMPVSIACNDHINFSVDANCGGEITTDMVLEGDVTLCTISAYTLTLADANGNPVATTGPWNAYLGQTLTASVTDPSGQVSCWGTVLIEDSSAPTQDDIDAACSAGGGDIPCDQVGRYLDASNATLGRPSGFTVGCSQYAWQLHDIDFTSSNSGCEYEITRTFRIYWTDKNGVEGFGECSRVFNSVPFNGTVTQPQAVVTLPCGSDLSPQAVADLGLANGGGDARAYPKIGSTVLDLEGEVCGVRATYTDLPLDACAPGCNGTKKVIRTWQILDWCEAIDGDADNGVDEFIQVLKAVDEEAPSFSVVDITVGTNPWDCTGNFELPEVEVHDNCDANPTYVGTTGPVQEIVQGGVPTRRFVGAPIGVHEFDVSYTDCCGNIGTRTVTVTVVDNVGPVVSTVQDIVVSLTPGGPNPETASAKIYWYHVDNQSYDACTDVTVEIRRPAGDPACNNVGSGGHNNNVTFNNDGHSDDNNRDTDGGQFVKFCCADLEAATVDVNGDGTNDEGYVEVIVRAYDALGNYNEAWSFVKVEDNTPPIISGPADATIYCDWPIEDNFDSRTYTSRGAAAGSNKYVSADGVDFDKTGVATAYSTCGATSIEYVDVIITTEGDGIDQCGAGQFTRIFRTVKTDKNGNAQAGYHFQKITILGRDGDADVTQDINNPAGVGPEDIGPFMVGCDGPSQADLDKYSPVVVGSDPCDVIGRAIEIDTFFFEQGACKKWTVEYKFVNWCDDEEWNDFELVTFMYIDTEKPVMTGCQDTMYAQSDVANCQHALELENSATDNGGCAGPENAWLKWQVYVDLWGDGTIDAYGSSYAFTGSWRKTNSANPFLPSNPNWSSDVWVVNVEATGSGEATDIPALPAELIQGNMSNHKVTWKVTDGCHNFASCSEEFMVVDKKAPTPYCRNLSTAVMNGSDMVELWAIDFNVDSEDNCTDKENLRYTFTDVKPQDDPLYDPTTRSSSRVFNCEDVPGGVYRMYVWDEKDNFDYCEVDLTVVDNDDSCNPAGGKDVSGTIATAGGEVVANVATTIESGVLPEYPKTDMTNAVGTYMFASNIENVEYTLTAEKNTGLLEGVNTLDLVKIQRHLLGLELLDSPYKVIAADIDNDESIEPGDLLTLRKAILGLSSEFTNNTSWRFVDGSQSNDDLSLVNDYINTGMLTEDMMDENFVAVKVGDVDGTVDGLLANGNIQSRSGNAITLVTDNKTVAAGEVVEVTFTSEELNDVYGYQFTMDLQGLEFSGVTAGLLNMTESNVGVLNSAVTVSYNDVKAMNAGTAEGLFTMSFVATEAGELSEMISSTSSVTRAEAYVGENLETVGVEIAMRGANTAVAQYELLQNEPNPFKTTTTIGYTRPTAGSADFTVLDVTGKVLMSRKVTGVAGYNEVTINKGEINVSGVLYYTLSTGDFTDTKKMIIIE